MLTAGSFKAIDPCEYDEIWLIVRQLRSMPRNPLDNIKHVRALSPSKKLLYKVLDAKKKNEWDADAFAKWYAPAFLREMLESPDAMRELKTLSEISKTKNILIACYCANESLCHRSLVKKIIAAMQENN